MWASKNYLVLCSELKEIGYAPKFEPGLHLGRGFADLGFEEYCLLTKNRLVSLFTGTISELRSEELSHFFEIPQMDQVLAKIHERNWDVIQVQTEDQRSWEVRMKNCRTEQQKELRADSLQTVLLKALIETYR